MAEKEVPSSPGSSYSEPEPWIAGDPVSAMADGLTPFERRDREAAEKIAKIEADDALDEGAKIDAVAEIQGWFRGDTKIIDAFLAGEVDEATTVERLAAPIDEAYSTANHGTAYYREEQVARSQRKYHSKEKAYEMWGPEQDFPPPTDEASSLPTTEGQLWELWYSVLHASKRLPWRTPPSLASPAQTKLLSLILALRARPDPPSPSPLTVPLQRNWIWQSGRLWSALLMLGPSARESWNDGCGCGAGWSAVEQRAWANVNAFVARLTAARAADFRAYGVWALGDAFESAVDGRGSHRSTTRAVQLRLYVTVAAAWVLLAGERMYADRARPEPADVVGVSVPADAKGKALPWLHKGEEYMYCTARWDFWRRRFEREAGNEAELGEEVRELCARAAETIKGLISSSSS
ncbi:hypothetical protein F4810DRAFT_52213 [Camillea tinctor]|nr:hypothetical protein F4810DRAFT_52213 [Camillea tinctor]